MVKWAASTTPQNPSSRKPTHWQRLSGTAIQPLAQLGRFAVAAGNHREATGADADGPQDLRWSPGIRRQAPEREPEAAEAVRMTELTVPKPRHRKGPKGVLGVLCTLRRLQSDSPMPQGTLFTEDFLNEGIRETWRELPSDLVGCLRARLGKVFAKIAHPARLNEPQTEERVIQPIFEVLNWLGCYSVQERAEAKGRANVPDYLLFSSTDAFNKADRKARAAERYPFGVAVADAKAWALGLDQRGAGAAGDETPSGQIIRYLTRADVQSDGKVLWGILTNGRHWRLYYQRAKSRLEDYFEIDLAWVLGLAGSQGELGINGRPAPFATDQEWSDHLLKLFWLMFRREAFQPGADGRTFHQLALEEGRNWETKVRESLTDLVFEQVFPDLLRALVRADPKRPSALDATYLATLRDAALTLLYRLLFALYAEDRDLLPKRDPNYGGLSRLRDEVAERIDRGTALSRRRRAFAHNCMELFRAIDKGDQDIGLPPYNGGRSRTAPPRPSCSIAPCCRTPILRRCWIAWHALRRALAVSASISATFRCNSWGRSTRAFSSTSRWQTRASPTALPCASIRSRARPRAAITPTTTWSR